MTHNQADRTQNQADRGEHVMTGGEGGYVRESSANAGASTLIQRAGRSPIVGFAPWLIYWVVASSPSTWLYGALAATLAAIILAAPSVGHHKIKLLDAVTIAFFIAITIAGIVAGAKDRDWMDTYSTPLSNAVLALVVLGSLAVVPFTEQYARESVPPEVWNQPLFKRTNRILTLVWGLVFAVNAICGLIAVRAPSTSDWTNWVIPIVLVVGAFKFTAHYPERVRARAHARG